MLFDAQNEFSRHQAVTTTALSTNNIDLGETGTMVGGDRPTSDPGNAYHGEIVAQVTKDFASGTSIQVQIVTADNEDMNSNLTVIQETPAIPVADLKAGYRFRLGKLPSGITQRYLGLRYVVDGTFDAGTISAGLVWNAQTAG